MSPRLTVVMALFLLVLALDVSYGTFCDEGPEGRYCFEDLSGWYNCTIDEQAQKMTEKKINCRASTRCQCFYGPKCPSSVKDPCGSYKSPPSFPDVFSAFYTLTITTCNNTGCTNETNIGEFLQDATTGMQRHDKIGHHWDTTFVFPFSFIQGKPYIQFDAAWFVKNCSINSLSSFPRFGVPSYFTCYKKKGTFKECRWQTGGHSKTEKVTMEKWLLYDLPDGRFVPYYHELQVRPTPVSNQTTFYDTMYASFYADFLDPSQLSLPTFCGNCDATGYPSTTPKTKPKLNLSKIGREILAEMKSHGISGFLKKLDLQDEI